MKKINLSALTFIIMALFISSCGEGNKKENTKATENSLAKQVEKFVKVKLTTDITEWSDNKKKMVSLFFDAAEIMDELYWIETYGDNAKLLAGISDESTKKYAMINYGPWDRMTNNEPFIDGAGVKPAGANFYPKDITKEEFDALEDPKKTSLYTLIRRDENGKLISIPYHVIFKTQIEKASNLLKQAAELAENEGLKNYLNLRAEALLTDDYLASDLAWMDMKTSDMDFIIGPIENYEDGLYGYKAAHESFILSKDKEWSKKLSRYSELMPNLQSLLPVEDQYKKDVPGSDSDINVYEALYYAGDCNAGSKTIAINLPNDERVHIEKGTRKLQLKNSMKAKFDYILKPISEVLIIEEQRKHVKFNAFFTCVMFHEVAHGMGIKNTITGKGTVREALKAQYSALEEGKADIMGLWLVTKLIEMGEITEGEIMDYYVTFFAGIFRSSRFGTSSSHGKANMMRFNYFKDKGAFTRTEKGQYRVNLEPMKKASEELLQMILKLQGDGNFDETKKVIENNGAINVLLRSDLNRLEKENIPVDVVFEQGKEVLGL